MPILSPRPSLALNPISRLIAHRLITTVILMGIRFSILGIRIVVFGLVIIMDGGAEARCEEMARACYELYRACVEDKKVRVQDARSAVWLFHTNDEQRGNRAF